MRKRKPLIVLLCILIVPVLATCCLCSALAGSMFFTQRGEAYTTGQQVNPYIAIARQDAINDGIPADLFVRQISRESGFESLPS